MELKPRTRDIKPLDVDHIRVIAEIEINVPDELVYKSLIIVIIESDVPGGIMPDISRSIDSSVKGVCFTSMSKNMVNGKKEIMIKSVDSPEKAAILCFERDFEKSLICFMINVINLNIFFSILYFLGA